MSCSGFVPNPLGFVVDVLAKARGLGVDLLAKAIGDVPAQGDDGNSYPYGTAQTQVTMLAILLAVAKAEFAMVSPSTGSSCD